ncbi:MAG: prohibitin family protein [Deltaproteobacteria bacterium]|nr:prohibitin family protein [Candidatus Tharpella sp.]
MTGQEKSEKRIRRRTTDDNIVYKILGCLLIAMLLVVTVKYSIITIQAGHSGVLWQRFFKGTRLDRFYDEGIHLIFPWDKMHIYNCRLQTVKEKVTALTSKGLPIDIEIAIYFRLDKDYLPQLHKNIGPRYTEVIVRPMTTAIIRSITGQLTAEEVFSSQKEFTNRLNLVANIDFAENFMTLENVYLVRISLPQAITKAIENKLVEKERIARMTFAVESEKQEKLRKEIESKGIAIYNQTVAKSLSPDILTWHGIEATRKMALSDNAKTIIVGSGKEGLPVILNSK